jgi:protein-S-isoprenylcysteine O-methyltransferase Ste14
LSLASTGRRLRLPLGFLFAGLYLAFARPTVRALALGAALAFVGVLVRAWAAGHIIKNDQLATTGPYAHTRNPLYFGSFLIAAGFAIAGHWALLLPVIGLFALIYWPTIEHERVNIRARFPAEYPAYERNVPAFLPRFTAWREPRSDAATPFSIDLYLRHGEWRAVLVFVLAVGWLFFRRERGGGG